MRAINANSAKDLRKAVSNAPRALRAEWMLKIQVGDSTALPKGPVRAGFARFRAGFGPFLGDSRWFLDRFWMFWMAF